MFDKRLFITTAVALALAAPLAEAANFPVSGSVTINGSSGNLPDGGLFGDATYDPASGELSEGKFTFPPAEVTLPMSGGGSITVSYLLTQLNTSTAQVAADGTAAMTMLQLKLSILATSLPFSVAPCNFQPIEVALDGVGDSNGLALEDRSFDVPPTLDSCGGFAAQINGALVGSSNSITLTLAGDFTPPGNADKIFVDGFDG